MEIMNLEYLDMVFYETLRMYPAINFLTRACVKDYTLPGTDIVIKKDEELVINVCGLHMNPDHYPEPEKFDPERFSKENKAERHP